MSFVCGGWILVQPQVRFIDWSRFWQFSYRQWGGLMSIASVWSYQQLFVFVLIPCGSKVNFIVLHPKIILCAHDMIMDECAGMQNATLRRQFTTNGYNNPRTRWHAFMKLLWTTLFELSCKLLTIWVQLKGDSTGKGHDFASLKLKATFKCGIPNYWRRS